MTYDQEIPLPHERTLPHVPINKQGMRELELWLRGNRTLSTQLGSSFAGFYVREIILIEDTFLVDFDGLPQDRHVMELTWLARVVGGHDALAMMRFNADEEADPEDRVDHDQHAEPSLWFTLRTATH